jgi:hypothetical protein
MSVTFTFTNELYRVRRPSFCIKCLSSHLPRLLTVHMLPLLLSSVIYFYAVHNKDGNDSNLIMNAFLSCDVTDTELFSLRCQVQNWCKYADILTQLTVNPANRIAQDSNLSRLSRCQQCNVTGHDTLFC